MADGCHRRHHHRRRLCRHAAPQPRGIGAADNQRSTQPEEWMLNRRTLMAHCARRSDGQRRYRGWRRTRYIPLISRASSTSSGRRSRPAPTRPRRNSGVDRHLRGPRYRAAGRQADGHAGRRAGQKPAAIGFAALDSQAAIPLLKQAQDAGIPVIAFDPGRGQRHSGATATDNLAAAALATADKMSGTLIGGFGKVALVIPATGPRAPGSTAATVS